MPHSNSTEARSSRHDNVNKRHTSARAEGGGREYRMGLEVGLARID